jgi:hypothetical protein
MHQFFDAKEINFKTYVKRGKGDLTKFNRQYSR